MSESIKAGLKPPPPISKNTMIGKSPKDLPGPKKLPGAGLVKINSKPDDLPQLKPPAPKSQVTKSETPEPKSVVLTKLKASIKPITVKKVGIDAPKMGLPNKDDSSTKQGFPKMPISKIDSSKSVASLEKAPPAKSVDLASVPSKSEVKTTPTVKFQIPVTDSSTKAESKIEQKLESQQEPSLPKCSEPKANLIPSKEQTPNPNSVPNKPPVPSPSNTHAPASQESVCSKNPINKTNVNSGMNPNSNFQNGILPQMGAGINGTPNFQNLDPAIWQMVTTIAAICSAACQNGGRSRNRHCCRKHHSRKHKKETELKDVDSNSSNKESIDLNELQVDQTPKESVNDNNKKTGERKLNQNDNTVSGTKWHGIEKKIATIRGLRDLEDSDSNFDDDELAVSNALAQGIGQPRYSDVVEFPSEIPAFNGHSKTRRYLAKQGVCTGPKFSKSPFVGGLSAARRRPYSSLTEMAAYFSNIEPQDQNDVIVMLLACRKLEKQIEEQQVVMQLLEHDLKEAQSLLRFPPEWRSLNSNEVLGHSPLPAGQIPSTNDPPYVSNHPNIEPPWVNKRPKDGLPSRASTKL
ncbi:putative low complexity protein [Cryptosporidium ubiquitum]|uniref:Putative low complexity protein n=1 Tax=Cryptosporidium ubiquitum TaxID=857276 RepID=A0A1J4MQ07_9CRYT|nr:putative low complexity protein [Cryptosporidium ubiquitum]OII74965.1 putative low complexity protein [Cryptosporidium ubiquitum]